MILDREASPGRALPPHNPNSTCRWPRRTGGRGWSPGPCSTWTAGRCCTRPCSRGWLTRSRSLWPDTAVGQGPPTWCSQASDPRESDRAVLIWAMQSEPDKNIFLKLSKVQTTQGPRSVQKYFSTLKVQNIWHTWWVMGRIYFRGRGWNLFCLRKSYKFCSSISNTRQVWFLCVKHS